MKVQHGDACLSLQQVYEWTRKFTNSTSSVKDSPRPGQAHNHLRERLCWLFWEERGVILEHYMPRGNTVNSATYVDLLNNHLRPAIKSKWCGLLSTGFVATWQCLAPYCPFNSCNNPRSVLRVSSTSAVLTRPRPQWLSRPWTTQRGDGRQVFQVRWKQAVHEWLCSQPQDFFSRGIHALPKRWNTCTVRNGDYIEKWSHCVPFVFNKLRDKKYFKVFIWLTYVIIKISQVDKMILELDISNSFPFYSP
jgi:hypothetical protein